MAGSTVSFPVVSLVASPLDRVGNKGCSGGRLRYVLEVLRSVVDELTLVDAVTGTTPIGEFMSESFVFLALAMSAPAGVACLLKTSSWIFPCARSLGENTNLFVWTRQQRCFTSLPSWGRCRGA